MQHLADEVGLEGLPDLALLSSARRACLGVYVRDFLHWSIPAAAAPKTVASVQPKWGPASLSGMEETPLQRSRSGSRCVRRPA